MISMKKRRPDYRKIRATKSYTIAELAAATEREDATVREWIKDGLQPMDELQPTMLFGWVVRAWLHEKWEKRRNPCPPGMMHCLGCKVARRPLQGSVMILPTRAGATQVGAVCIHCGSKMNRTMTNSDAAHFQKMLSVSVGEIAGFVVRDTWSTKPAMEADSYAELAPSHSQSRSKAPSEPSPAINLGTNNGSDSSVSRPVVLPRNPHNERLKSSFFEFCEHAQGRSSKSIRKDEIALLIFDQFGAFVDRKSFCKQEAMDFKSYLKAGPLELPTILSILKTVKRFLVWLKGQPGFNRNINSNDVEYLNLTSKERRSGQASSPRKFPSIDDVTSVLRSMPAQTFEEQRNRALVALFGLTGIRVNAARTLKLKRVDVERLLVRQASREVETKFSKEISSFLFPMHAFWTEIFVDWVNVLRTKFSFSDADPLFPKMHFERGRSASFQKRCFTKDHWADGQMATRVVKAAFQANGFPAHGPHSFRHMIVHEMYGRKLSILQDRALSQNLGHSRVSTTHAYYGKVLVEHQGELVKSMASNPESDEAKIEKKLLEISDFIDEYRARRGRTD
ncbi:MULTISPECIES: site-specific integrase [unclassified Mesorhizobium]|uniref:tyrosine-type recombinase/integrase n=1 Tax=unclassified Mesorhizobium TaxID=325217 RepID=UPI00333B93AD